VNFLPNHPLLTTEASREESVAVLKNEMLKETPNIEEVAALMTHLFSTRRECIMKMDAPAISVILEEWPALKMKNQVKLPFYDSAS
jgi:hypothetical protein